MKPCGSYGSDFRYAATTPFDGRSSTRWWVTATLDKPRGRDLVVGGMRRQAAKQAGGHRSLGHATGSPGEATGFQGGRWPPTAGDHVGAAVLRAVRYDGCRVGVLPSSPSGAQVSVGFVERSGQPRLRMKRSQAPAACDVITAVSTSVV